MPVTIKAPYLNNYAMPNCCVACGAHPSPDVKLKASGGEDRWSFFGGTRYININLEFPLCAECGRVNRNSKFAVFAIVAGILSAVVLCCANAHLMGEPNSIPWFMWGLGLPIVLAGLGVMLFRYLNRRGLTTEQLERRKIIRRCVRVSHKIGMGSQKSSGYAFIDFGNEQFGKKFAELNSGTICTVNGRE
jgi:hypothetical protein